MRSLNLDALNIHLFETIEMLKNNSDPKASENEKIDVETAKTIADIGKVIVDTSKVKVQALAIIAKADNPNITKEVAISTGIINEDIKRLI